MVFLLSEARKVEVSYMFSARLILTVTLVMTIGFVWACSQGESQSSPEPAGSTTPEPTKAAPAAAAETPPAEETPPAATETAGGSCAKVSSCCSALGTKFGGGAVKACETTATAGVDEACNAYLKMNSKINQAEGHPMKGQLPAGCLP